MIVESSDLLKFGEGNAKLDKKISTFALPAGRTCPFAKDCLAYVQTSIDDDGNLVRKLVDGPYTKFRCYAASLEVARPNVYRANKHNFDLLKKCESIKEIEELIDLSLPKKNNYIRIHTSGDFYSEDYFKAWLNIAKKYKDYTFYTYTKCIQYVLNNLNKISKNFIITCSHGGKQEDLLTKNLDKLKSVKIYFSPEASKKEGVKIDHDDSLALDPNVKLFGLLLHGVQPKNTKASAAIKDMKNRNIKFSYSTLTKKKNNAAR